jgi:hypothetical protein
LVNFVIYPCEIFANFQSGFNQSRSGNNKEGIDMTMQTSLHRTTGAAIFALGLLLVPVAAHAQVPPPLCPLDVSNFTPDPKFTSSFMEEKCKWTLKDLNPFFRLRPGWQTVLESEEEVAVITVLNETRKVDGIKTRVVEELAFEKDGEDLIPIERSLNFYAICEQTGSVFYFGEDSMELPSGDTTGSWLAGTNGAQPGIIMPGTLLVGGGYYEEVAPSESALDKARIVKITEECEAGEFNFDKQCVETFNTSDCNPNAAEQKVYAAGIGNVKDQDNELTSFGFVNGHGDRPGQHHDDDDDRRRLIREQTGERLRPSPGTRRAKASDPGPPGPWRGVSLGPDPSGPHVLTHYYLL